MSPPIFLLHICQEINDSGYLIGFINNILGRVNFIQKNSQLLYKRRSSVPASRFFIFYDTTYTLTKFLAKYRLPLLFLTYFKYFLKLLLTCIKLPLLTKYITSHSEVFLRKGVLNISSKLTREHPYRSVISVKLQSHFGMGVLLQICCIFSEYLFLGTPPIGCFRKYLDISQKFPLKCSTQSTYNMT